MTLAVVYFAAALAVGIHEAWSKRRGVLGSNVNIPVSFVGAFVGAELGNVIFDQIFVLANLGGPLAATVASPCFTFCGRHDALHSAGVVDRTADRQPVALMSLVGRGWADWFPTERQLWPKAELSRLRPIATPAAACRTTARGPSVRRLESRRAAPG